MNKPDIASGSLSAAAAALILWILVLMARTSEAISLLDGRLAALEGRKAQSEGAEGRRPGGDSSAGTEEALEALEAEMASIGRDLQQAAFVQNTLGRSATSSGGAGVPRTYPELVRTITANLAERERADRLEYARQMVEMHVRLATHYSDKLKVGLNLQPEQQEKVLEIVRDQVRAYEPILALEVIGEEALAEVARIDEDTDRRILAELKPEQATKYADIKRPWLQALVHRTGSR